MSSMFGNQIRKDGLGRREYDSLDHRVPASPAGCTGKGNSRRQDEFSFSEDKNFSSHKATLLNQHGSTVTVGRTPMYWGFLQFVSVARAAGGILET